MEKNSAPLGRRGECARLRRTGDAAPTFLSSCRKKSRRRSGGKERRFMSKACPLGRFGQIRELSWPVPCELAGPYRVRYTPAKQRTASPHLALRSSFRGWSTKGLDFWPRAFRFATRCLGSCSPPFGGVVQNRGPAGPLVWPFQGGVGETGEAPPVADEASLFRGSGAIGGPKGAGNRNAATVLKSKRPHVSGGGRRGRCLCAKDISPFLPRPPRFGGP